MAGDSVNQEGVFSLLDTYVAKITIELAQVDKTRPRDLYKLTMQCKLSPKPP